MLGYMIGRVARLQSFFHVRINDGEVISMFNTRPEDYRTADDSVCYRELGAELLSMFVDWHDIENLSNVFVGASWMTDPDADTEKLVEWCRSTGLMHRINWTMGQDVLHGIVTGETLQLFDAIRGCGSVVVLLGRRSIRGAMGVLGGTRFLVPPEKDCWTKRGEVFETCAAIADTHKDAIFVWCTGLGLKATSWKLWKRFPRTTHIGLGSMLDGLDGSRTREWMRHEHQPWWRPYVDEFLPYVRSFALQGG